MVACSALRCRAAVLHYKRMIMCMRGSWHVATGGESAPREPVVRLGMVETHQVQSAESDRASTRVSLHRVHSHCLWGCVGAIRGCLGSLQQGAALPACMRQQAGEAPLNRVWT